MAAAAAHPGGQVATTDEVRSSSRFIHSFIH